MDVREKLVELLSEKCMETCKQRKGYVCSVEECKRCKEKCCGFYADHLIANGVTVQEWISVKDMLPEENEIILAWVAACRDLHFCFGCEVAGLEVTHWMPLPEPPEEGTV